MAYGKALLENAIPQNSVWEETKNSSNGEEGMRHKHMDLPSSM
jgi:hypothetical protein